MENNIAPCGIYCPLCHAYQRGNCPGCRNKPEETRKSCLGCTILKCGKYSRYCYECGKPCKRLITLDNRYISKYGVKMLGNLDYIRENGEKAFVALQKEKYTCPDCGNLRTVHYDYCIYCRKNKLQGRNK